MDSLMSRLSDEDLSALVNGFDAVILSADEPLGVGQTALEQLARQNGFLLVCTGYSHHTAIVRVVDGKHSSGLAVVENASEVLWYRSKNFIGPSFGATNVEIAGVAASIVLHNIGFPCRDDLSRKRAGAWQPSLHSKQVQI